MKVLILTQYYPPETGAPQNRLFELATRLKKGGVDVEVLTAMPNYPQMRIYSGYRGRFYCREVMEDVTVHRSWIYATHSRSVLPRLLNYFSFVFTSFLAGCFRVRRVNCIVCESPPLFLGISAWLLSRLRGAKMIFNVSDLWPESAEKLGIITNTILLRMARALEEGLYRSSAGISGQTQGIVDDIRKRFPAGNIHLFRNGVDTARFNGVEKDPAWRFNLSAGENEFLAVYAGIIGHAQGLDVILDAAVVLGNNSPVRFVLVGSGPEKGRLQKRVEEEKISHVHFLEPMQRHQVASLIASADAAVVPLQKLDLFLGAIPSKIFEALALSKPVMLGVNGEARKLFAEQGKCAAYFEPENATELAAVARKLCEDRSYAAMLGANGKNFVETHFQWSKIVDDYKVWLGL